MRPLVREIIDLLNTKPEIWKEYCSPYTSTNYLEFRRSYPPGSVQEYEIVSVKIYLSFSIVLEVNFKYQKLTREEGILLKKAVKNLLKERKLEQESQYLYMSLYDKRVEK